MNRKRWKWLGYRIGKRDDRLILKSVIFSAFFVFCMVRFLQVRLKNSSVWVSVAAMFILVTSVLWGIKKTYQRGYVRDIQNRQGMARMLLENGWFETEPLTKSWTGGRARITYFPALYYRRKDRKIYVAVKISMGRYQEHLLHLESKLETGLACELVEKNIVNAWVYYTFLCDVEKNRIRIDQVHVEHGEIRLMEHISWTYSKMPHMLVAGMIGGGKTYYLLELIVALLRTDAILYINDPKNADLACLEAVLPEVYHKKEDIMECVCRFYDEMVTQSETMRALPEYRLGMTYEDLGLPANFLIFDEYVAFMDMLAKKEIEDVISMIKKIVMLGRQAGFMLILACQRPDAKYLGEGIRDQFGFRAALGKMSDSGYTMMFGSTDKNFTEKTTKGRGYVDAGNGVVTEFYAPFVPEGHDFFQEIMELWEIRTGERNIS